MIRVMEGVPQKKFSSPEEEITYLRTLITEKEQELLKRSKEVDAADIETLGKQVISAYNDFAPDVILESKYILDKESLVYAIESLKYTSDVVEEVADLSKEIGVKNTLIVFNKLDNKLLRNKVYVALVHYICNMD